MRDLTDGAGVVVGTFQYDAFGWVVGASNLALDVRQLYAGYEYQADVGLYYVKARWYNPQTARWMQVDPIGFGGGDPNLYAYVHNSPTNYTDPSGLQSYPTRGVMPTVMPDGSVRYVKPGSLPPDVEEMYRKNGLMHGNGPNTTRPADLKGFGPPPQRQSRELSFEEKLDLLQGGLDAAGVFDPTPICDGINAIISLMRGHPGSAVVSIIGAVVPYLGDTLKGGKYAVKGLKAGEAGADALRCAPRATRPTINTRLPDKVAKELPAGQIRTPEEVAQARNFFGNRSLAG